MGTALMVGGALATPAAGIGGAAIAAGMFIALVGGVVFDQGAQVGAAADREIAKQQKDQPKNGSPKAEGTDKKQGGTQDTGAPDASKKPKGNSGYPQPDDWFPNPEESGGSGPVDFYGMPADSDSGPGGIRWASMPNPEEVNSGGPRSMAILDSHVFDAALAALETSVRGGDRRSATLLGMPKIDEAGVLVDPGILGAAAYG
ncbi:hypothetical protein ACWEQW_34705 [Streptomyces nigra]